MRSKFEKFGLLGAGAFVGILVSITISAWADRSLSTQAPPKDLQLFAKELQIFANVYEAVKTSYVEPVEDQKLINEALSGMLQGLDPHSTFLDQDAYKELQSSTEGVFGGLGIEVAMEEGLVKVVTPIEDTPAYHAGLKSGDLIMKLDDTQVRGLSLSDAVKRMRGAPDTNITLTVLRKGEDKPLTFTLTRAIIKTQSVKNKWIEQDYGYVRITQFQDRTGEDLTKALMKLRTENKGPLKGLVLDLRNNPGGLLNAAVGVSAAFLAKDDLVVYTDGRARDSQMRMHANPMNYIRRGNPDYIKDLPEEFKSIPMVVLINAGSASASEIVAGALQDHKRATIMGIQSFGKGSVQTILPIGDSGKAIKLTTARYYTPNGRSIQAKGIVPDVTVDDGSDPSLSMHEADLKRHLSNPADAKKDSLDTKPADETKVRAADKQKEEKRAETRGPIEPASQDDFQFVQAMNQLKGLPVQKAPAPATDKVSTTTP